MEVKEEGLFFSFSFKNKFKIQNLLLGNLFSRVQEGVVTVKIDSCLLSLCRSNTDLAKQNVAKHERSQSGKK